MSNYFSNPSLITAAKTAVEALQKAGRSYEDIVESLQNAVIEAENEVPLEGKIKKSAKGQLT